MDQVNSGSTKAQAIFDDATLYPNPYMVVTRKGYTKHYYAGTERIATVIGTGGFDDMVTTIDNLSSQHDWDIVKTFFTGKERDWETGYDYFGARYWWLAGTWLSPDPLCDKYPEISPYAYCGWNPVKYIFFFLLLCL